ncbi:MAG: transcriptional regulator PpsR [Pseudomonadota bacterium]
MKQFETLKQTLGGIDAGTAASLIAAAADVALVVDSAGIIQDVSVGNGDLAIDGCAEWVGRSWIDTVTPESRPKITALLKDADQPDARRWRHVNYPSKQGADIPLMYSAVQLEAGGRVVALGRDLRSMASLQQRLVDAQQSMEHDYMRLRHLEARYRLLFDMASDAVLVIDGTSLKVVEANPAAIKLIGVPAKKIMGHPVVDYFSEGSRTDVANLLGSVTTDGKADGVEVTLPGQSDRLSLSASLYRQETGSLILVHLRVPPPQKSALADGITSMTMRVLSQAPDAFVVTDMAGQILTANQAFLGMCQLSRSEQVVDESLDRWLGRSGVDLSVLLANLRQRGSVRLFSTSVRGANGTVIDVEISAIAVTSGEFPCLGFTIRDTGPRLGSDVRNRRELPRSAAQLTELVGRVPLKDIVGETTDMIEQLCIEAALELTQDNRASASEMLGLSRQSLYVKLRRFGLGDLSPDGEK